MTAETPQVYDCEIQVRLRDLNVGGHVDNVEIARVISEARTLFLRFADIGTGERTGLLGVMPVGVVELVVSQSVEYRAEMYFSPFEPYLARMWISRIGTTSFGLSTEIRTSAEGEPTAVAETTQVLRDTSTGDGWEISDQAREVLSRYLAAPVAMR
ncbi:acyl-CoA thioester hydrolase [Nocardioides daedukensis]|uniref:Acyl-CoA thioester hydrolase n=1 Tax=Nocardioides daedukensis TaxID=634462 RepID=A0A7Y9S3C3_9ACTN|nr:acyl-CoA thioesterase [Nocardioides daedukensis]NYG59792.1 acyl-CoA thioester hydrolase [Nocardioides daedukensis]